jgi:hypothetical protein
MIEINIRVKSVLGWALLTKKPPTGGFSEKMIA